MDLVDLESKLLYKKDKKTGRKRISKLKIIIVGIVVLFVLAALITALTPATSLTLNEYNVTLNESQTNYVIRGLSEPGANIELSSKQITIKNATFRATGEFEIQIAISKDITNTEVNLTASAPNKAPNTKTLKIAR